MKKVLFVLLACALAGMLSSCFLIPALLTDTSSTEASAEITQDIPSVESEEDGAVELPESEAPPTEAAINYTAELTSGYYTAGVDFPAGKYDIEAISGGGNVISSNAFSGGINAILGTEDKGDMYEQLYSNIDLPEGEVLSVSGVKIRISSDKASGSPLSIREQPNTETIPLGNGNFVAGEDFPEGVYDVVAVEGGGNVTSDNAFEGGINAIMGTQQDDMYEKAYKNVSFPSGTVLTVDGVKIELIPSK